MSRSQMKKSLDRDAPARILLVDDRSINLDLLQLVLEPLGESLVRAQSGEEALQHLMTENFAVMLLEAQMPGLDGFETARLVRARNEMQDTPIIFLTSSDRDDHRVRDAYSIGAVDFVYKPISPEIIRAKVSVFVDLFKAKRRVDQLLNRSEEYNRALLKAIPDAIFRIRRDGSFVDYIPGEGVLEDLPASAILGKTVRQILQADVAERMMNYIRDSLAGVYMEHMEWTTGRQGTKSIFEARISRCGSDEVLVIVRDITQQRLMEMQAGTTRRLEAVGRVAAGVAHDFNSVLMAVQYYAGLLRERSFTGEEVEDSLNAIAQAVEEGTGLTSQLLAFSRGQTQELEILDLNKAIADLDKILRQFGGEPVELFIEAATNLPKVKANLTQIQQVLMNLVMNACDAMPEGGKLTIRTRSLNLDQRTARDQSVLPPDGEYVILTVRDTGIGMDEQTKARMFEPFYSTKGTERAGGGFGLATVYSIVKQCKGFITVSSEPGCGATFDIYFPSAG